MRKLKVKDIAPASKLLSIIDIKADLEKILSEEKNATAIGLEIIGTILQRYGENPKAEKALAEFLSGVFEMPAKEILDMDIDEFMACIKEAGGINTFKNFFVNALQ